MKKRVYGSLIALAIVCHPAAARAGAWARPLGGVYLRAGAGFFFGQQSFTLGTLPPGRFRGYAGELYGEVGVSHGLEINTSIRVVGNRNIFDRPVAGNTETENVGAEDLELYLKWAPFNATTAFSVFGGTRLSLYEPLPVDQLTAGVPRRGQGGYDLLAGVAAGYSFHPAPVWVTGDLSGRYRFEVNSGGLRIRGELGARFVGPFGGAATLEVQAHFGNTTFDDTRPIPTPVPMVFAVGAKLFTGIYRGLGASADFAWYPDLGNSGPGVRFGIGLTYEFTPPRPPQPPS